MGMMAMATIIFTTLAVLPMILGAIAALVAVACVPLLCARLERPVEVAPEADWASLEAELANSEVLEAGLEALEASRPAATAEPEASPASPVLASPASPATPVKALRQTTAGRRALPVRRGPRGPPDQAGRPTARSAGAGDRPIGRYPPSRGEGREQTPREYSKKRFFPYG